MNLQEQLNRIQEMMGLSKYVFSPDYYLEDFYFMDGNEMYDENRALKLIKKEIEYVKNITYPLKVFRGINTKHPQENYSNQHWTTKPEIAESFGDKIFVGLLLDEKPIDFEQTIRTRVMNPYEYEITIPNFNDVKIIDVYNK